jgi:transposase
MRAQDPKFSNNTLFWVKLEVFIDPNHKLVKLRNELPWDDLVNIWDRAYSNEDFWNEKIHPRIMVWILIYHAYYLKKSFRELKEDFRYNIVLQYFCGYEELQLMKIDHSTINKFESALWEKNIKEILRIVENIVIKKQPPRSKGTSVCDTTVIPSNIAYPTDINLLEKVRLFLHEFILENQKITWDEYRTYARTARENYIWYSKSRRISKKDIKKVLKKHIQFVRRNLTQTLELVWRIEKLLEKQNLTFSKKETKRFEKLKKKIEIAKKILSQQEELYKEWKLPKWTWRIVSFHRKNIRPIYRWKKNNKTEFWMKVDFIKIWNAIILWKNSYDNFHDWSALWESIDKFGERWIKERLEFEINDIQVNQQIWMKNE